MDLRIAACVLASAAWLSPGEPLAQAYPAKPVRVVMPSSPGGGTDFIARQVLERVQQVLGQPFVLDFRPGAGGAIGAELVARAAPDGYTLMYSVPDPIVMRPATTRVPYDPVADFTPITAMITSYRFLIANPKFPVASIGELIEYARRYPGKVSYGTNGVGTASHFLAAQLAQLAGIDMLHVPYKTFAPAVTAVLSGEIPVLVSAAGTSTPLIRAGKVRALLVLDGRRSPDFPDVPAATDVAPAFQPLPSWQAFLGPARMPDAVRDRLRAEIVRAVAVAEVRAKLAGIGQSVLANTPEEFAAQIRNELSVIRALIKATGIQPE